ncbi:MAG: hypothetical protein O6650_08610 [Actinobacteria bacterium]|jgi:hypothetical protein|nr:hypothetical protein [Actinomycetota bacterium]MCZ6567369.1 hypothetical protein [Actinomycetota bacterium]MCZ6630173.1 hypothetical protein [Actinomycetota bacterium]MCZ6736893.1 hypothetical protein [Actinomycetota bacterium]
MNIHWTETVGDDWGEIRAELDRAFQMSRAAARDEESFVYVVHHDDLLGRRGAGDAMVASGLLSAARTAALEGVRKGWTANVIARDENADPKEVELWAERMLESHGVTGELIRIGSTHIGKALP